MDIGSLGSSFGLHSGTSLNVKGMLYWSREVIRKSCPWANMIALDKVSYGHLTSPRTGFTGYSRSLVMHSLVPRTRFTGKWVYVGI